MKPTSAELDRLVSNAEAALAEIGAYFDRRKDRTQHVDLQKRLVRFVGAVCDPFGVRSVVRDSADLREQWVREEREEEDRQWQNMANTIVARGVGASA
jgi:hypothetical protein